MTRTKHQGVYYRDNQHNDRVFYIQYKKPGGKKLIRQKIGTKSEGITPLYCKKLRDQTLVKLRLGEDAPVQTRSSVKTLKEVSDEYFKDSEARSKSKLQSVYKTHLSFLDNEPITAIDKDVINDLKKYKSKEKSAKTKRVLSPKTVNNILAVLSTILHFALEKDYIKSVPKIKKYSLDNSRERFLSVDEINALYAAIENSGLPTTQRLLLFTKISLVTGARLGSVITIKGKDINRTNQTVSLRNHKTGKRYTGFIPTDLMNYIPPLDPQEKLIDVSDAKQIQRPLQAILDKLFNVGLNADDRKDRVVVHSLRHTFASHLAINGTPIHKIMKLMDHGDIAMTLRYAKLDPNFGRSDVENLYG